MLYNETRTADSWDMFNSEISAGDFRIAPTDRGVSVPNVNTRYITFEEYKAARCSSLLALHYESSAALIHEGLSLAEMLEKGYEEEVLRPSLLRS